MKKINQHALTAFIAMLISGTAWAGPVDNGNTLALDFVTAKTPEQKKLVVDPVMGKLEYFRYLKILEMTEGMTGGTRSVFIKATEPSSDMVVEFTVIKSVSLKIMDDDPKTKVGDAVGVQGRLVSIGKKDPNTIVIDPVIVKHKDKLAPGRSKEALYEIDPTARMGTITTSGKAEKVLKGEKPKK